MILDTPTRARPHRNKPPFRHGAYAAIACLLLLGLPMAWGQDAPHSLDASPAPHDPPRHFTVDLDGDGEKETVSILGRNDPDGAGGGLRVSDSRGCILWESGPDQSDFHFFPDIYWPSVIGDADGDGEIELLAREPLFDVSPSSFFLARWKDGAFRPVSSGWSLIEQPHGGGEFRKTSYVYDGNPVAWIMDVLSLEENGELLVAVYQDSEDRMRQGTAVMRMHGDMGGIVRWIKPLQ